MLKDQNFFKKKKIITEKIFDHFAVLIKDMHDENIFSNISFPPATDVSTGKISKGENYLGFPFFMLDLPRLFNNDELLAIRTMVWWGNLISCTLLVSGSKLEACKKAVLQNFSRLAALNTSICISDTPWHHHFDEDNYKLMLQLKESEVAHLLSHQSFLKLSRKIPVGEINNLLQFSIESMRMYANLLKDDDKH